MQHTPSTVERAFELARHTRNGHSPFSSGDGRALVGLMEVRSRGVRRDKRATVPKAPLIHSRRAGTSPGWLAIHRH